MGRAIFDTHGGDSELNSRTGSIVEVIRPLTKDEADIKDVGPMYEIRFADGYVTDAFADELDFELNYDSLRRYAEKRGKLTFRFVGYQVLQGRPFAVIHPLVRVYIGRKKLGYAVWQRSFANFGELSGCQDIVKISGHGNGNFARFDHPGIKPVRSAGERLFLVTGDRGTLKAHKKLSIELTPDAGETMSGMWRGVLGGRCLFLLHIYELYHLSKVCEKVNFRISRGPAGDMRVHMGK